MKLLPVLIFWLPAVAAADAAPAQVTIVPVSKEVYLRALQSRIATRPEVTYPLKKKAGRIVIPTSKGGKVFQDKNVNIDNDTREEYSYDGYLPQLRLHQLTGTYWESSKYMLIDAAGNQTNLAGLPEYSPAMRSFVVTSADLELVMMPNEVQLFQLQNGVWRKTWEARPETWEPAEAFWTASNVLFLKKKHWKDGKPTGAYTYLKITTR